MAVGSFSGLIGNNFFGSARGVRATDADDEVRSDLLKSGEMRQI
jgi:hypothetical protein